MLAKIVHPTNTLCYHCGDICPNTPIHLQEKSFCCGGCKMVYQILNKEGLCDYYQFNKNPGTSQRLTVRRDKFAFLEDAVVQSKLINFSNNTHVHVTFYIPQIHCSSCLYLLENLHRLNDGIVSCKVNFTAKEVTVIFLSQQTSLHKGADLLTTIGYEPYISLNDIQSKKHHG